MPDKHTDADLVHFLQVLREAGSQKKAAAIFNINVRSVRARKELAETRGLTADTPIRDPLEAAKIENKILKRKLAAAEKREETAAELRRTIYKISEHDPAPPRWTTSKQSLTKQAAIPMTMWSDWHYGEVVKPAEVCGLNEFNSDIAQKRIKKLVDRTIRLVKGFAFKEKSSLPIPGIVVCLGGDMISGDIHEELADTNDRKPLECIDELIDITAAALEKLADEFGKVFVPCVVGNHGRTSHKPRMKGRIVTSYEWNLYCNLKRYFRNDERVQFLISENTDAYFTVAGHRFLLTHGDSLGVSGGDGIIGAIGPIMRGAFKTFNSEAQVGREFDTVVMGHWHQELWLPGAIVNNALKGYDEYARLKMRAKFQRPGQNLWFIHPEQGITARMQVYVDDLPQPENAVRQPWVVVP